MALSRDFVFLHGGSQGGWVWTELVDAMRAQDPAAVGRSLVLDVPGCGVKRERPTETLSFDQMAGELADDIRASGVKDAILVGHSQAGTLIPRLLEALPGQFSRAVYVSCCAPAPGQTVAAMMGAGLHGSNPEEVGWPADPGAAGHEALFQQMFCNDMSPEETQRFLARRIGDQWPAVCGSEANWRYGRTPDVPATYVACLEDGILPMAWQLRFAERLGADRVVKIHAGHQAMNTRPHGLAEILRREAQNV
jgi:pimeloyl-ACP methyl ester carboxylesterase